MYYYMGRVTFRKVTTCSNRHGIMSRVAIVRYKLHTFFSVDDLWNILVPEY